MLIKHPTTSLHKNKELKIDGRMNEPATSVRTHCLSSARASSIGNSASVMPEWGPFDRRCAEHMIDQLSKNEPAGALPLAAKNWSSNTAYRLQTVVTHLGSKVSRLPLRARRRVSTCGEWLNP